MTEAELLKNAIRRARAEQPPELQNRFCRICGPFMLSSCPAAPKHVLRPLKEPMPAKKNSAPIARKGSTLDSSTRDISASLRDAIAATDAAALEKDPEEEFIDFACRLVLQLQKRGLTIVSIPTREEQIQISQSKAAARILEILTTWMRANPGCSFDTRKSESGKFQIVVKTPKSTELFFGESVQDAYAQAAQTINFNGGTL